MSFNGEKGVFGGLRRVLKHKSWIVRSQNHRVKGRPWLYAVEIKDFQYGTCKQDLRCGTYSVVIGWGDQM